MRLFTLLLTLIILGLGGYFAGSAPYRQEWTDVYWISLTALGAVTAASTFFLGQTIGRFDKLIEFPLDSLQQEAFSSALRKRRNRLWIKWWMGLVCGILAIALGFALQITKLSIIAGWAAAFIIVSLVCLLLIVVESIALSHLLDQLKEQAEHQRKKQAFLTGSEA